MKKFFSVILLLTMAVSLVACGASADGAGELLVQKFLTMLNSIHSN